MKLGQGYVFTCVCDSIHRWVVSQHALQVVLQHALQQVSRGAGHVVSQHALQVSRPTPKEEVQGSGQGGLQAHTPGGCLLQGVPAPGRCVETPL